jgi:hypothetical protein
VVTQCGRVLLRTQCSGPGVQKSDHFTDDTNGSLRLMPAQVAPGALMLLPELCSLSRGRRGWPWVEAFLAWFSALLTFVWDVGPVLLGRRKWEPHQPLGTNHATCSCGNQVKCTGRRTSASISIDRHGTWIRRRRSGHTPYLSSRPY